MSRRREGWWPHAGRSFEGRPSMAVPLADVEPAESDDLITESEWANVFRDLVKALLCGAFVVLAWVAVAWWLGVRW